MNSHNEKKKQKWKNDIIFKIVCVLNEFKIFVYARFGADKAW